MQRVCLRGKLSLRVGVIWCFGVHAFFTSVTLKVVVSSLWGSQRLSFGSVSQCGCVHDSLCVVNGRVQAHTKFSVNLSRGCLPIFGIE